MNLSYFAVVSDFELSEINDENRTNITRFLIVTLIYSVYTIKILHNYKQKSRDVLAASKHVYIASSPL